MAEIKGSTSCYKGSNWKYNRFSSGGPSLFYFFYNVQKFAFYSLVLVLKGTFMLRAAFMERTAYVLRCPEEIWAMNYYSKKREVFIYELARWKLGARQTVAVPSSAASHLHCRRADKYCAGPAQIIYSHTVWVYISRELAMLGLTKSTLERRYIKKSQCPAWEDLKSSCDRMKHEGWVIITVLTFTCAKLRLVSWPFWPLEFTALFIFYI